MKLLQMAAAAVALGLAGAAHAETFTFINTNSNQDQVVLNSATAGGRPSGATTYSAKSATTYADGKKVEVTGRCSAWVLPPSDQFGQSGVCQFKDASGGLAYAARFTCGVPSPKGFDCWGILEGAGGAWKDRIGAFTGHSATNGFNGEGHWN